jgi:hypothetical protein
MQGYSPEQRSALLDASEAHFCSQYQLKIYDVMP